MKNKNTNDAVLVYSIKNEVYFISYRIITEGMLIVKSPDGKMIGIKNIVNSNYGFFQVPDNYHEVKASVVTNEGTFEKRLKINH